MMSSYLDTLLKVSKTTSPQKLFDYDCILLYIKNFFLIQNELKLKTYIDKKKENVPENTPSIMLRNSASNPCLTVMMQKGQNSPTSFNNLKERLYNFFLRCCRSGSEPDPSSEKNGFGSFQNIIEGVFSGTFSFFLLFLHFELTYEKKLHSLSKILSSSDLLGITGLDPQHCFFIS